MRLQEKHLVRFAYGVVILVIVLAVLFAKHIDESSHHQGTPRPGSKSIDTTDIPILRGK